MDLKYKLTFYDYWHIGSGLSGGSKVDNSVLKDDDGLPYVSAKTIKGLAREYEGLIDCTFVNTCFGGDTNDKSKCYDVNYKNKQGQCYFTNAVMHEDERKLICVHDLQDNLFDIIASTKIGSKNSTNKGETEGIAVTNSLREIEVVVPISLYGEIKDVPDGYKNKMIESLKYIKRMGLNRNRGLGRCEFSVVEVD